MHACKIKQFVQYFIAKLPFGRDSRLTVALINNGIDRGPDDQSYAKKEFW